VSCGSENLDCFDVPFKIPLGTCATAPGIRLELVQLHKMDTDTFLQKHNLKTPKLFV
jgi:hypothetical protein